MAELNYVVYTVTNGKITRFPKEQFNLSKVLTNLKYKVKRVYLNSICFFINLKIPIYKFLNLFEQNKNQEFEIWMQGYSVTGNYSTASFEGISHGKNFKEACINYYKVKNTLSILCGHVGDLFDKERITYWGCQLYDNEKDARKIFG